MNNNPPSSTSPSQPDRELPKELPVERLAYNVTELCSATGLCRHTIYNLEKRGKLRAIPHLRTKLFARAEVERFLSGKSEAA